jgi:hypothetical protein
MPSGKIQNLHNFLLRSNYFTTKNGRQTPSSQSFLMLYSARFGEFILVLFSAGSSSASHPADRPRRPPPKARGRDDISSKDAVDLRLRKQYKEHRNFAAAARARCVLTHVENKVN